MLVCDMCDKGYHTFCLQPAMDSLPTNGWRCKVGKDKSLLHTTASELPHSTETVKYTSSREQIMFSNNSPWMISAASDQQYSHTILLCIYIRAVTTFANIVALLSFTWRLSAVCHSGSLLSTHAKTFSAVVG